MSGLLYVVAFSAEGKVGLAPDHGATQIHSEIDNMFVSPNHRMFASSFLSACYIAPYLSSHD